MWGRSGSNKKGLWHGERGYFIRLFFSCLLMVALPVGCMGSVWYMMTKVREEKKAVEEEENHIEIIVRDMGEMIAGVGREINGLEYGPVFKTYLLDKNPTNTVYLKEEMSGIKMRNEVVYSVYYYDCTRDRVYCVGTGSDSFAEFYDKNWLEMLEPGVAIQHLPVRDSLDPEFVEKVTRYGWERIYPNRKVLSVVSDGNLSSYFVVNLDVKYLVDYFHRTYVTNERDIFLINTEGLIVGANGKSLEESELEEFQSDTIHMESWSKGKSLYFSKYLGYGDLYYIERIPYDIIYGGSEGYKGLILGIIALIMVSMMFLTSRLARKLYEPIGELYHEFGVRKGEAMSSEDEIAMITRTFHEMEHYQESYRQSEKKQKEFNHAATLRMLFNHIITQEDFIRENADLYQKEDEQYQFLVCRMGTIGSNPDAESDKTRLKEVLNTYLVAKSKGIFIEYQYGIYVILLKAGQRENTKDILLLSLKELFKGKIYSAVSPVFRIQDHIYNIFHSCNDSAFEKQFFEREDTAAEEVPMPEVNVINYEAHIIRSILLCDVQGIAQQMRELQKDMEQYQSAEKVLEICQRILVVVNRECRSSAGNCPITVPVIRNCTALREVIQMMQEEFTQVCLNIKDNTANENRYCKEAKEYINKHYMKNMNVSEVADYLGISYAYLSKIFKNQFGGSEKLLDYLNRIRIEKAKELLASAELSLNEIADQVGYNNTQSLQRFFKKYENTTLGDYRKMCDKM